MRAWELKEATPPFKWTSHDKLWINPAKKQIIDVPADKHHTQLAYERPEKFALSGNLFKDHEYPLEDGKPTVFDKEVATAMFDSGWVRVNVDKNKANVHCTDLKQCHVALRVLKQRYNDIDEVHVDVGVEITPEDRQYVLQNDEYGKGSLRTFMRTGKIAVDERSPAPDGDNRPITQPELDALESMLDRLYAELRIDVDFSKHFMDRVNDARNETQITIEELQKIFTETFKKYKNRLKQEAPGFEAVMNDISTDLNIPFVFDWDAGNQERDMVAKTVMRKPNFGTSGEKFVVGQTSKKST